MLYTATYSPDDNKLRLYASARLDAETYARVKAAGFKWAPKQECFYTPSWHPAAEDLAVELAGEIEDDDKSLAERAEERAERFEGYEGNRRRDAEQAHAAVKSIADNIPLGQPILVGHHSERHARRDAEKIENGMRRAVRAWKTAEYWSERAAGAIRHAKYKERPDVRARRIKTIEAERRKVERSRAQAEQSLKIWEAIGADPALLTQRAIHYTNTERGGGCYLPDGSHYWSAWSAINDGKISAEEVRRQRLESLPKIMRGCDRWLEHYDNRLTYERAMLADSGGLVSDRQKFEPGGRIKRRGEWLTVLKVNAQSVTVSGHWATTVSFDEIQDYQPPSAEAKQAATAAAKIPPLCNYPGEGFRHMTRAELDAAPERRWSDFGKTITVRATDQHGAHRVQAARKPGEQWSRVGVYVTDEKRKDPPAPQPRPDIAPPQRDAQPVRRQEEPKPGADMFAAMEESLRAGVQVVAAPQLFPTPPELAARMVDLARIPAGARVLEPSAGTGAILDAIAGDVARRGPFSPGQWPLVVAVEVNRALVDNLQKNGAASFIHGRDFLQCNGDLGKFDRVLMNPPFENGADIKHIQHARSMLAPGGRLVAICANGPRQQAALQPLADSWEELPAGTFAGTGVRAVLLTMGAP